MMKAGRSGQRSRRTCKRDARVALAAVPVAPVALELEEQQRHLVEAGLDLLQADDVGPVALDPVEQLRLPRADAVDVPGRDLHEVPSECGRADIVMMSRCPAGRPPVACSRRV